MPYLEDALTYLQMGWSVYPAHSLTPSGKCTCGNEKCTGPGKHPIGSWATFQKRLPTTSEVRSWFTKLECNIGMVTGRISGIAVVDVDGDEGMESLKQLQLDPTLTARTGSGGLHLYYSLTKAVQSKVGMYPGIDLRADGGYVVLPPSFHASGRMYKWTGIRGLKPFPRYLIKRLRKQTRGAFGNGWRAELLKGVPEGERSNSAARLSGRYFSMGLSPDEVWILMTAWNERNYPPLDLPDLKRTVRWAQRKHEENLHSSTEIVTTAQILALLKGDPNA